MLFYLQKYFLAYLLNFFFLFLKLINFFYYFKKYLNLKFNKIFFYLFQIKKAKKF